MNKFFSIAVIMIFMMSSLKAQAQVITMQQLKNEVSKQVVNSYREYTDADLKVELLTVPFSELNVKDGSLTYKVTSNSNRFMARDVKRVEIYVNGSLNKVVMVPVEVKAYKNVMVARSEINRESAVTPYNTLIQRREVSTLISNVLSPSELKRDVIAKKMFKEGEVIDKRFLTSKPDVVRNQEVTAFFKSSGIMISISATAQSDGNIGDYITLKSPKYQKVYRGKVIGPNKVLITI